MRSTILSLLNQPPQPPTQDKKRPQQQARQAAPGAAKPRHHPCFTTPDFINSILNLRQQYTPKTRRPQYCAPGFLNVNLGTAGSADEEQELPRVPALFVSPATTPVCDNATQTDDWSDGGFKRLQSNLELALHLCDGLVMLNPSNASDEGGSHLSINWRIFHEKVYASLMEESWRVDSLRKSLVAKAQSLDAMLLSSMADQERLRVLTQENALLRQHIGTIGAENARLAVLLHDANQRLSHQHHGAREQETAEAHHDDHHAGLFHLPYDCLFS